MRWVLVLGVVSALTLAHVAGSATSTRYVLWSTRTAGAPAAPVRVLPADLPDDRQLGAPADLLDRTAAGRVAVASIDELVIENVDGSARAVVPLSSVYDGRFSPDGSMLVLASLPVPTPTLAAKGSRLSTATVETCACWRTMQEQRGGSATGYSRTSARSPPTASGR